MTNQLPRHIAIIMDGNGRWAKKRLLPRVAGHKAGVDVVRQTIKDCVEKKIEYVTFFAFSSENWGRPQQEVSYLMELFLTALEREAKKLHEQNIQLRIIGDTSRFSDKLRNQIQQAQDLTKANTGTRVIIAANYGGKWDITQAVQTISERVEQGILKSLDVNDDLIKSLLSMADAPDPDLFIRTSGEQRISNFLLWQLAYTELYFTEVLWPDFDTNELNKALEFYANRERRFGFISEQLREKENA